MSEPTGVSDKRVGNLELFFDLVFVFAITQLVGLLHADHSPGGWARMALMLWLVWWAWSQYAWAGNAIDLERSTTRVAILGVAGLMLLTAAAIPTAFDDQALLFALAYAGTRGAGLALYWHGLRDDPNHRAALRTFVPLASLSPILILVGGIVGGTGATALWSVAVAVDVASLASAGRGEFRVAPGHFAERHGLIVIVALGESIVAVGATAADLDLTRPVLVTVGLAFGIVAALWWSYFDWVHAAAHRRLASEPDHRRRGNLARDLFTIAHLPLVGGTVVVAAGIEEALHDPTRPLDAFGRVALGCGLAAVLAGFVVGNRRATGHLLPERAVAIGVVGLVAGPLAPHLDAVVTIALLAATLAAALLAEQRRRRRVASPAR